MIECHDLPTAKVFAGTLFRIAGNSFDAGTEVSKIVMFDKKMTLASGTFGIIRCIQISSSILAAIPLPNSKLTIGNEDYKIINPQRHDNPAFVTFWESEIQRTT